MNSPPRYRLTSQAIAALRRQGFAIEASQQRGRDEGRRVGDGSDRTEGTMMFTSCVLQTRSGAFVVSVTIPEMKPPPEVLQWGQRLFVQFAGSIYREAVLWNVENPRDTAGAGKPAAGGTP